VLSATIDHLTYGSLSPRPDNQVSIESVDFGMSLDFRIVEDPVLDGKLDLVKAAITRLRQETPGGYDLVLRSNAPPGSGLGSSSTMMVTLVGLLRARSQHPDIYLGQPVTVGDAESDIDAGRRVGTRTIRLSATPVASQADHIVRDLRAALPLIIGPAHPYQGGKDG
jgi:GHMP kinases N terminal domain